MLHTPKRVRLLLRTGAGKAQAFGHFHLLVVVLVCGDQWLVLLIELREQFCHHRL